METKTLLKLIELARAGATVLFVDALPADVPGFGQLAERRTEFKAQLAGIQLVPNSHGVAEMKIGDGRIAVGPANALLAETTATREQLADIGLRFIRRKVDSGYLYFIVNQTRQSFEGWAPLMRPAQSAMQMNPRRGGAGVATVRQRDGTAEVYLQIAPGESFFIKTLTSRDASGNRTHYSHRGAPVALNGDWHVTALSGGPELPPAFTSHELTSWTSQSGEWERFGGTARYETEFSLPDGVKADNWLLDLGDVRETARVFVNDVETDLIWSLPTRTNIGAFLKPGKNKLVLEVTNLAANRIRDLDQRKVKWKKFHEINFVNIFYKPFDASNWPLQPSGLLGPVNLVPLEFFQP